MPTVCVKNIYMKVVFMGTPDFAVAVLKVLVEEGIEVVAVVTAPDKPTGRGQKMNESAVKKYAQEVNLPVLQPEKLRNQDFISELRSFDADVFVVVAFRMLPEVVWSMPPKGTINLHGSLLPQYRGAAPIHWAVINGEKETGVTTFFIEKEIDTGNIIFSEKITIGESENTGSVHFRLMEVGANLVLKTVKAIDEGEYPQIPQDFSTELKHAPKIFKETCQIDWSKSIAELHNFVRGMSPFPVAWTMLNEKVLKIYEAEPLVNLSEEIISEEIQYPGISILTDKKTFLAVKTSDGFLNLKTIQLEGKKRMEVSDFLRGYHFE